MSKLGQAIIDRDPRLFGRGEKPDTAPTSIDFAGICQALHRRYCAAAAMKLGKQGLRFNDPEHAWLYAETLNDLHHYEAVGDQAMVEEMNKQLNAIRRDDQRMAAA